MNIIVSMKLASENVYIMFRWNLHLSFIRFLIYLVLNVYIMFCYEFYWLIIYQKQEMSSRNQSLCPMYSVCRLLYGLLSFCKNVKLVNQLLFFLLEYWCDSFKMTVPAVLLLVNFWWPESSSLCFHIKTTFIQSTPIIECSDIFSTNFYH